MSFQRKLKREKIKKDKKHLDKLVKELSTIIDGEFDPVKEIIACMCGVSDRSLPVQLALKQYCRDRMEVDPEFAKWINSILTEINESLKKVKDDTDNG